MKKDKSPQGKIDRDILPLLKKINAIPGCRTTSSCSGRIVLISSLKKGSAKWLFKSHKPVTAAKIFAVLQASSGLIWFLQEPMILHVKCSSLEKARMLISKANKAGFKAAALSAKTFTVEIRGNERMELPLEKNLVSKAYLALIVKEANAKLKKTKGRMKALQDCL